MSSLIASSFPLIFCFAGAFFTSFCFLAIFCLGGAFTLGETSFLGGLTFSLPLVSSINFLAFSMYLMAVALPTPLIFNLTKSSGFTDANF